MFLVFLHLRTCLHNSWRIFLLEIEFWGGSSFLSAYWKCFFTSFGPHGINENSVVILIIFLPSVTLVFSGFFHDFPFVYGLQQFDYNLCGSGFLWIYPVGISLYCWICRFLFFIKFEMFSVIISSIFFTAFSFPSGTLIMSMLDLLVFSHKSLRPFSL